jgi:hypothetical protein
MILERTNYLALILTREIVYRRWRHKCQLET